MLTMLEFTSDGIEVLVTRTSQKEYVAEWRRPGGCCTFRSLEECIAHLHVNGIRPMDVELVNKLEVRRR